MVISNKPVQYETDDRDGNHKFGIVLIKAEEFTRDLIAKNYKILIVDYVDSLAINRKVLTKSYAEIDGLRTLLLNSGKDYSKFKGSELEDELLADAMVSIIKTPTINNNTECHYHSIPQDWIRYIPPVIEIPIVEPIL